MFVDDHISHPVELNFVDRKLVHSIEWYHDGSEIYSRLFCAAPAGSFCRMTCQEGCPTWPCPHELKDCGFCNAIHYMECDAGSMEELYNGENGTTVKNGPILLGWNPHGEFYVWTYPE